MTDKKNGRFFLSHKKASALIVSIAIHAGFALVALTFVAVTVINRNEVQFEPPPSRPHMNLRKLRVPVNMKKTKQAPKLRQNIMVQKRTPDVNIQLPEIVGIAGGIGTGNGLGGSTIGFDFDMNLFGSDKGAGNDFIGTFYDLKQDKKGNPTTIGKLVEKDGTFSNEAQRMYHEAINSFVRSGWRTTRLDEFYSAPKNRFASFFNFPPMNADAAPKAFGVEKEVKPSYWLCHYQGTIMARKSGRYRVLGEADDVLIVRIGKKLVLDGCWPGANGTMTSWKSDSDINRRFPVNVDAYGTFKGGDYLDCYETIRERLKDGESMKKILSDVKIDGRNMHDLGNYMNICNRLAVGDWITLKAGQRVDMEVLIGEIPGGAFNCRLLVEMDGGDYRTVDSDAGPRDVLPIFKTAPIPDKIISKMKINTNEMTIDGPVFGIVETE
ncbi:MAG: hypothetical protein JXR25_08615 [Pontiellaceae bacterium]|nr:hypothetical protein [Pontiellaceae bacterium]MBN2784876.1 hypothetical protein [Pontiellaceae bacterium]